MKRGVIVALTVLVLLMPGTTATAQDWPEQVNRMSDEWRYANEALILEIAEETGRPLFEDLTFMSVEEAETGVWQGEWPPAD